MNNFRDAAHDISNISYQSVGSGEFERPHHRIASPSEIELRSALKLPNELMAKKAQSKPKKEEVARAGVPALEESINSDVEQQSCGSFSELVLSQYDRMNLPLAPIQKQSPGSFVDSDINPQSRPYNGVKSLSPTRVPYNVQDSSQKPIARLHQPQIQIKQFYQKKEEERENLRRRDNQENFETTNQNSMELGNLGYQSLVQPPITTNSMEPPRMMSPRNNNRGENQSNRQFQNIDQFLQKPPLKKAIEQQVQVLKADYGPGRSSPQQNYTRPSLMSRGGERTVSQAQRPPQALQRAHSPPFKNQPQKLAEINKRIETEVKLPYQNHFHKEQLAQKQQLEMLNNLKTPVFNDFVSQISTPMSPKSVQSINFEQNQYYDNRQTVPQQPVYPPQNYYVPQQPIYQPLYQPTPVYAVQVQPQYYQPVHNPPNYYQQAYESLPQTPSYSKNYSRPDNGTHYQKSIDVKNQQKSFDQQSDWFQPSHQSYPERLPSKSYQQPYDPFVTAGQEEDDTFSKDYLKEIQSKILSEYEKTLRDMNEQTMQKLRQVHKEHQTLVEKTKYLMEASEIQEMNETQKSGSPNRNRFFHQTRQRNDSELRRDTSSVSQLYQKYQEILQRNQSVYLVEILEQLVLLPQNLSKELSMFLKSSKQNLLIKSGFGKIAEEEDKVKNLFKIICAIKNLQLNQRGYNILDERILTQHLCQVNVDRQDKELLLIDQLACIRGLISRQAFCLTDMQIRIIHQKFTNFMN